MAIGNNSDKLDDEGFTDIRTAEKVFNNVYSILCLLQCLTMLIIAAVFFHNCPGSIILGIYLIFQGLLATIIPILMCYVFRCGRRMKRVTYYTACVTVGLICTGWGIAGTYWVDVAECKSSNLYKAALGLAIATWLLNGLFLLFSVIYRKCYRTEWNVY
ncbi:uncharacterized protein LOC124120743 [Haliotis rufescens]|uniref:uncharacterized protein LOC124120743 n=1 Tax=Haliotis rufescens TaxID=6454 RepID=UPI00201F0ED5|nr:uncharacterized protein LOC124120743 [Haliotis rufescens]